MATAAGVVKKVKTTDFRNAKTRGIIAIKLDDGDKLISSILTSGTDQIMLITRQGQALRTSEHEIRPLGRSSRGVTGIRLSKGDELAGALRVEPNRQMLIMTECGYGKRVEFSEFSPHGRATGGQKVYTLNDKTGEIVGLITVSDEDEVVCITSQGKTLRVKSNAISLMGRAAQGVRILNIDRPDILIGLDTVANDENPDVLESADAGIVSISGELDLDGNDEPIDTGLVDPDVMEESTSAESDAEDDF